MEPMAFAVFNESGEHPYHVFADRHGADSHAANVTQDSADPDFNAEVHSLFAVSREQIESLREYVMENGSMHDEDCPGDDTCDCAGKKINDHLNELCRMEFPTHPVAGKTREEK